jgi:hypothetical protein
MENEQNEEVKRTRQSKETKNPLPDSRTSLEKQIKILKSLYVKSNKGTTAVNYKDVSLTSGINDSLVSGVLGFLYKIELLNREKGSKYVPVKKAIEFCNTLDWDPDNAGVAFGKLIDGCWFTKYVVSELFAINSQIDEQVLINNLGKFSEADPDYHKAALRRVVDYLEYGKIIAVDEATGKYKLVGEVKPTESGKADQLVNNDFGAMEKLKNNSPSSETSEKDKKEVISSTDYVIRISGPGINSTIVIKEEEDFDILNATLKKIRKNLPSTNVG